MTERSEQKTAAIAVMRQTAAATRAKIEGGATREKMAAYAAQVRERWQEKLDAYLEEHAYDRVMLREMIALVRGGTQRLDVMA